VFNFSDDMRVGKITSIRTSVLETATPYSLRAQGGCFGGKVRKDFFDGLVPERCFLSGFFITVLG